MAALQIRLGDRSYEIHIANGILSRAGEEIRAACPGRRVLLITEPAIGKLYAETVLRSLSNNGFEPFVAEIPGGEQCKTLATVADLYEKLLDAHMDRTDVVVTLGGGVIGDIGGFAAATYLRGIDFAQIPTSLLAQVDASIGGKVGVDLPRGKNLVGAFHQPSCVVIDPSVICSLPQREFVSGLAEIIKHGIISDQELVNFISSHADGLRRLDPDVLAYVVQKSCEIKGDIVSQDEKESGLRAVLNLGHTVGHGVEAATGFVKYSHGEAVAIGMVTAALISEALELADTGLADKIVSVLSAVGLPVSAEDADVELVLQAIRYDKKVRFGKLKFVLPKKIGEVTIVDSVTEFDITQALAEQQRRYEN